jgi:hypothetical protein
LVKALPGRWAVDVALSLREKLAHRDPSLVVALGFAHGPPRLKIYLQEASWQQGLGTPAELAPFTPACRWPSWLADCEVGVLTVDLAADGGIGTKAYFGAADLSVLVQEAPAAVQDLANQLVQSSPLPGGWWYLTARMDPGREVRYAVNKIYNPVQLGFTETGPGVGDAWDDVQRLFASAGNQALFDRLRRLRAGCDGLVIVPTATALEQGGRSTDIYFAAWPAT